MRPSNCWRNLPEIGLDRNRKHYHCGSIFLQARSGRACRFAQRFSVFLHFRLFMLAEKLDKRFPNLIAWKRARMSCATVHHDAHIGADNLCLGCLGYRRRGKKREGVKKRRRGRASKKKKLTETQRAQLGAPRGSSEHIFIIPFIFIPHRGQQPSCSPCLLYKFYIHVVILYVVWLCGIFV